MEPVDQQPVTSSSKPASGDSIRVPSFLPVQPHRGSDETVSGEDADGSVDRENVTTPVASVFKQTSALFDEVTLSMSKDMMEIEEDWTHFKGEKLNPIEMLKNEDKWEILKEVGKRCPYYVFPIMLWLPSYNWRASLLPDVIAGIGVAFMLIPQALSYALLAGVPPEMGLYTAWSPLIVFACMTTSRGAAYGPDALASLLVGLTIQNYPDVDSALLASSYALLCGIILLLLGIFRFGFLDHVLSRPLLSGFVNAVAIIILIEQINGFFGLPKPTHHMEFSWQKLYYSLTHLYMINWTTFLTGLMCLYLLFGQRIVMHYFPQLTFLKYIIGTFVVVVVTIIMSYSMDFERNKVAILNKVDSAFPIPRVPIMSVTTLARDLGSTAVIVIVGFIESIVAIKIYAQKKGYQISQNRELVALGAANIIGSFFRIYPTFVSLPRSAMADFLGASTQLYTFVTAFIILLAILFGGPLFYYLPIVAMNSIIIVAATSLFEFHDLLFLIKIRAWADVLLLIVTFVMTLALGVDIGIFVGIAISLVMVVKHTTYPHISLLGKDPNKKWVDVFVDKDTKIISGVIVVKVDDALYFGNVGRFKEMVKRIETFGSQFAHPTDQKHKEKVTAIVIHAKNISEMDASATQELYEMVKEYEKNSIFVCFVKLRAHLKQPFVMAGIIGPKGGDISFDSTNAAMKYIQKFHPLQPRRTRGVTVSLNHDEASVTGSEMESAFMTDVESAHNVPMERTSHSDSVWGFAESFLASTTSPTTTSNNTSGASEQRSDPTQEAGEKQTIFQNIIPYEKKAI